MDPTKDFLRAETSDFSETPGQKLRQMAEYVAGLEAERRKIEAFKRELPLCLDLLNDAVERFREELSQCREAVDCRDRKVEGLKPENDDMKGWMSSVQLWNHAAADDSCDPHSSSHSKSMIQKENVAPVEGGPNMSFKGKVDGFSAMPLSVTPIVELDEMCPENVRTSKSSDQRPEELKMQRRLQTQYHQTCRKQRRCWSPELHRKFVDALGQLGGSEVATPKQIRDVMKVEGLTNDEVKSHLQKYRLHVRKTPSPVSRTSNRLTMSQDDQHSRHLNKSRSISPQGPFHRSVGSEKGTSNYSMEYDAEADTEGHSWQDRIIFRPWPCLPTC